MTERTLLVTGFEPFGGETVNASWEAASRLEGWRGEGFVAAARKLPCVYDVCVVELSRLFEALLPAAILMTGQAARRSVVSVERIARNEASAVTPDNHGVVRGLNAAADTGRPWLESGACVGRIARAILGAGVPARVSVNAGDYVCNHLYYGTLVWLHEAAPQTPAVFIHLPATPRQLPRRRGGLATERAVRALQAAAGPLMAMRGAYGAVDAIGAPSAA